MSVVPMKLLTIAGPLERFETILSAVLMKSHSYLWK